MDIETIWKDFSSRIAEIELYGRNAKEVAKSTLKELQKYEEHDVPKLKKMIESSKLKLTIEQATSTSHAMFFKDPTTGEKTPYSSKSLNIDERFINIQLHRNKQYQWLLSEAYEEFEDYLEKVYAFYGKKNNSFWPLEDYGDIRLSDIPKKDYQWYVERSEKKKNAPHSILKIFREQFNEIERKELNNGIGINLKLAITLIEKLRHIIVHKGGKVDSKEKFIELVARKSNLFQKTKGSDSCISKETTDFINLFFGENEYSNLITILDIRVDEGKKQSLNLEVSLLNVLIGYLMSYANLLYINIKNA